MMLTVSLKIVSVLGAIFRIFFRILKISSVQRFLVGIVSYLAPLFHVVSKHFQRNWVMKLSIVEIQILDPLWKISMVIGENEA
ncbi:MAG: hypothetical protein CMH81_06070 [Nitrospiraceae bacterium]|nr:hypothetical protein [Nitrospiraceae bacterium]